LPDTRIRTTVRHCRQRWHHRSVISHHRHFRGCALNQLSISSIQAMLAPAVLMTTAAILAAGVQTMYSSVNDRMRDMTAEKLARLTSSDGTLVRTDSLSTPAALRVALIDTQLPLLRTRHRLLRDALEVLYGCILLVVICMILIAIAVTLPAPAAGTAAVIIILSATIALLVGLLLVGLSVQRSVNAVDYEVDRVLALGSPDST
jgi:hypothetical protein